MPPQDSSADAALRQRNEYVESHLHLVDQIARKLARRTPPNIEFDDLVQAGRVGLLSAAGRYTRALNVPFGAYARKRIEGEMRELLRRKNRQNGQCEELPATLAAPPETAAVERRMVVVSILDRMPRAQRQALTDYFAGDQRGCPPRKVNEALQAARKLAA